jgi:hypothetical protein
MDSNTEAGSDGPFVELSENTEKVLHFDSRRCVEHSKKWLYAILYIVIITVPAYWVGYALIGKDENNAGLKFFFWFFGVLIMTLAIAMSVLLGKFLYKVWYMIIESCNCLYYVPKIELV